MPGGAVCQNKHGKIYNYQPTVVGKHHRRRVREKSLRSLKKLCHVTILLFKRLKIEKNDSFEN